MKQVVAHENATKSRETDIPDVVLSLLGAGLPIAEDDLNGRKAYAEYISKKHQ